MPNKMIQRTRTSPLIIVVMFPRTNYMLRLILTIFAILTISCSSIDAQQGYGQQWAEDYLREVIDGRQAGNYPESGFVPNAEVAIAIAVTVWEPIYGKAHVAKQAPYFAYEVEGYWVVHGSLRPAPAGHIVAGGTAKAIIEKRTGKIIHVIHHK